MSGIVGTPMYFSPEQQDAVYGKTKGGAVDINQKIDIYALGLILIELSADITTQHEKQQTFKLVKESRKLPSSILGTIEGRIILHLTEKESNKRPSALFIRQQLLPLWRQALGETE